MPSSRNGWRYRLVSMGLRLSVHRSAWQRSVEEQAATRPGLIPVVKGNGYGFGRRSLMPLAARLSSHIAVGSVYEAGDVPGDRTAIVLTPHIGPLPDGLAASATLTIASVEHVHALHTQGWRGDLVIKLQSSMRRYGVAPHDLATVTAAVRSAGCVPVSYALHFPLVGTARDHAGEIHAWLPRLAPELAVSVSHLDTETYRRLGESHPERRFQIRCGTDLWHADKSLLYLSADVLDLHSVSANDTVGYRGVTISASGHVALVAAGSSHGVRSLDDGKSPFHFGRQRLALVEPPHMHTSMVFIGAEQKCPNVGDRVDVQRPLTQTQVDEVEWLDG